MAGVHRLDSTEPSSYCSFDFILKPIHTFSSLDVASIDRACMTLKFTGPWYCNISIRWVP
ncbi:hypothetical protein RRG08_017358 [Elysia crispata]|uniref:Uncharacterized protein n=1 Tax=Elysia crispata TaxID=231223 RepID=A0AAE1AKT8_9GAST|nr:hypothetical protein RRG08_017358 [Elysia crispata]